MGDLEWERALPLEALTLEDAGGMLRAYDPALRAQALAPIGLGCRNSNYVLDTNKGRFFLRLAVGQGNNEGMAWALLGSLLPMPRLYWAGAFRGKRFYLYEHIEGVSLQRHIMEAGRCDEALAEQAGRCAAVLHSVDVKALAGVDVFVPPPFETWYATFLENKKTQMALGKELLAGVQRLLERQRPAIMAIAGMPQVPIHADFRPANMLLDTAGRVKVVDWEAFGIGHALGDVGQFFRYRRQFGPAAFRCFRQAYDRHAAAPLPQGWEDLALLRDLVNPLQMLGMDWEAPAARADFLALVEGTVRHFQ